jgi:hypothetical protein
LSHGSKWTKLGRNNYRQFPAGGGQEARRATREGAQGLGRVCDAVIYVHVVVENFLCKQIGRDKMKGRIRKLGMLLEVVPLNECEYFRATCYEQERTVYRETDMVL